MMTATSAAVLAAEVALLTIVNVGRPAGQFILLGFTVAAMGTLFTVGVKLNGYRPLRADEQDRLAADGLWHITPGMRPAGQEVILTPLRCRWWARMFRADRPLSRPCRAIYFFTGQPDRAQLAYNLSRKRRGTVLWVAPIDVPSTLYLRRFDGAVAAVQDVRALSAGPVERAS